MSMAVWNHDLFQDRVLSVWFDLLHAINLEVNFCSPSLLLLYNPLNKHTFEAFITESDQYIYINYHFDPFLEQIWQSQNEN